MSPEPDRVIIVHRLDLLDQFSVCHLPRAGRPLAPGVVAAGRHIQHPARAGDWEPVPVVFGEADCSSPTEPHRLGCEEMATASFRMSRHMVYVTIAGDTLTGGGVTPEGEEFDRFTRASVR